MTPIIGDRPLAQGKTRARKIGDGYVAIYRVGDTYRVFAAWSTGLGHAIGHDGEACGNRVCADHGLDDRTHAHARVDGLTADHAEARAQEAIEDLSQRRAARWM